MIETAHTPDDGRRARPTQGSTPDTADCRGPNDVGKIHHDEEHDIWYECVFDRRRGVFTWAIVPAVE